MLALVCQRVEHRIHPRLDLSPDTKAPTLGQNGLGFFLAACRASWVPGILSRNRFDMILAKGSRQRWGTFV
jgi:hypothetical protein